MNPSRYALFITTLFALTSFAEANEVVNCKFDDRASDGSLTELVINQTAPGLFEFRLLEESSGMGGALKIETAVSISQCQFSKTYAGVGTCQQVTVDGFRGPNRLSTALAYENGRDQLRASIQTSSATGVTLTQEISFDLTSCKFTP